MKKPLGWLVLVLAALVPTVWARGAGYPVKLVIEDNAGLFSEEARESARQRLSQVSAKVNREVHLKTYPGLPENLKTKYEAPGADKAKKAEIWREFTNSHLQGERGLVILVCWKPGHVEVAADKALASAGLDAAKTRSLREHLAKMLDGPSKEKEEVARKKELDKVLGSFVNEIAQAIPVERARSASSGVPTPSGAVSTTKGAVKEVEQSNLLGWVCLGVVGLMVVWMIFGAMRGSSMGGGQGVGGPGYGGYGGGGGGGFLTNMLGGMFGAAAGMWMYNHFFGGGTPTASAGGFFGGGEPPAGEEAGTGDFSGGNQSGGDFGDSSGDSGGGGWFGGGDSSGGDWGGGGGGGDFGGGDFGGD